MGRKVILDVDPGIDDALMLAVALFDPDVEVLGVTSVPGNASATDSAAHLTGLVEFLDPPRLPRIGVGSDADDESPIRRGTIHGMELSDERVLPVAERCSPTPAEKVICDLVRNHPHEISILTGGPLTNLARAFARDPELPFLIRHLFITGGTYESTGNCTPVAEFNIHTDPKSAQKIFASGCEKTLVPLDVTSRMKFRLEHLDELPPKGSRFGEFLRKLLLTAFRAYRQQRGMEQILLPELVTWVAMTSPELFARRDGLGDVETGTGLCRGQTVFDRRAFSTHRPNMAVLLEIESAAVCRRILDGFHATDRHLSGRDGFSPD